MLAVPRPRCVARRQRDGSHRGGTRRTIQNRNQNPHYRDRHRFADRPVPRHARVDVDDRDRHAEDEIHRRNVGDDRPVPHRVTRDDEHQDAVKAVQEGDRPGEVVDERRPRKRSEPEGLVG